MKILVLGAGAVGGYFGARLQAAGQDVSFLVRPARAALLREQGLRIRSPRGDLHLRQLQLVQDGQVQQHYDLVLLSCKAYDLQASMDAIAPAIGPDTVILPALNGMAHLDRLAETFGADKLMPGLCIISSVLDADGTVVQLGHADGITFGDLDGGISPRAQRVAEVLASGQFESTLSDDIMPLMWAKWVQLATLAACTTSMRAAIGDIHQAGGEAFIFDTFGECLAIARAHGIEPPDWFLQRARGLLGDATSSLTASMYRDICNNARVEADHVIGDMVRRGQAVGCDSPRLRQALLHLKAYEAQRARQTAQAWQA